MWTECERNLNLAPHFNRGSALQFSISTHGMDVVLHFSEF